MLQDCDFMSYNKNMSHKHNCSKLLVFLFLIFVISKVSAAKTHVYIIQGMSCSKCVKKVKETLCQNVDFKNCSVKLGQVSFETKDGLKKSNYEINKILKEAGPYKIFDSKEAD